MGGVAMGEGRLGYLTQSAATTTWMDKWKKMDGWIEVNGQRGCNFVYYLQKSVVSF